MKRSHYDVIISGAGPVGLFLASELAQAKCSVLILEKAASPHSPLKQFPFGTRGLSAPTVESLDRRGLLSDFEIHKRMKNPHQNAEQGPRRQVGHFAGIPFREGHVDTSKWRYRLASSTPTSLLSEMEEVETILARRAENLGVEVKRGLAITDFQQTRDDVTVQAGDETYKASWLVGCDGGRSRVRKIAGFEFAGTEPEFTGYSAKVDIADPEKLQPGRNVTERGMYLQSQPGFVVIQDFDQGAMHAPDKPITREHVQEVLRRISNTDVTITTLHFATTWTDRARQATCYRQGRVFLAGDAAHIHSPLGGQGLNLGLGDAMNLGWKLAATIQQKAPHALLDTYHLERHPIGEKVLDWSRAQVVVMRPDASARALNAVLRDLLDTQDGATYIAERVWGISTHYDLGGDHPLLGYSVPNFEFENGAKMNELLREGRGVLLDFTRDKSAENLASEYGGQIKYIQARAKENLGLNMILIRPDGIIAWATDREPNEESLRQAADRWFAR